MRDFLKNPQTRNARPFLPLNISAVGSVHGFIREFTKVLAPLWKSEIAYLCTRPTIYNVGLVFQFFCSIILRQLRHERPLVFFSMLSSYMILKIPRIISNSSAYFAICDNYRLCIFYRTSIPNRVYIYINMFSYTVVCILVRTASFPRF